MIVDIVCLLNKPEYMALAISIIAIVVSVYIANENRKHLFAKEEYFKLQQIVEKIIAKLLFLNNQQVKLKTYIELSYKVSKSIDSLFIDSNDTFNKKAFEKNGEEVAAMIDIYFGDLGQEWNACLTGMSDLHTQVFILSKKLENKEPVQWETEVESFNKLSLELADRPKNMADKLKQKLNEFKKGNLQF